MEKGKDVRALFGTRVRLLRKERGWSQEKLALECGLDRSYVGGVERGERNIALVNIAKLAMALGVPLSTLCDLERRRARPAGASGGRR